MLLSQKQKNGMNNLMNTMSKYSFNTGIFRESALAQTHMCAYSGKILHKVSKK